MAFCGNATVESRMSRRGNIDHEIHQIHETNIKAYQQFNHIQKVELKLELVVNFGLYQIPQRSRLVTELGVMDGRA